MNVEYNQILPIQNQIITATSNEKGKGILLVIQPAEGIPWIDYLNAHPELNILWNLLSNEIKTEINKEIGGARRFKSMMMLMCYNYYCVCWSV